MVYRTFWHSDPTITSPRIGVGQFVLLTLRFNLFFVLGLLLSFALVAFGLSLVSHTNIYLITVAAFLFITAGLISLFSFSRDSLLPSGGKALKQIVIEQNRIEELIRKREDGQRKGSESTERIFHDLYRSFLNIANSGSTIISSEANAPCAVSVKLLWIEQDDDITIRRFLRDSNSRRNRLSAPEAFSWWKNTAFRSIALNHCDYFSSDNLSSLAAQREYDNVNAHWTKFYNSTAVAPIRSGTSIIGFVCVDSWYGKLSDVRIRRLVEHIASDVYTNLRLLITIDGSLGLANAEIGFGKANEALVPSNREAQLHFQSAVMRLHSAVQPIVDKEDDAIQHRASLARPAVELGVPDKVPQLAGAFMKDDFGLLPDEIPSWALNNERERLSKKASELSKSQFVEILKRSATGNPYAERLLKGTENEPEK